MQPAHAELPEAAATPAPTLTATLVNAIDAAEAASSALARYLDDNAGGDAERRVAARMAQDALDTAADRVQGVNILLPPE